MRMRRNQALFVASLVIFSLLVISCKKKPDDKSGLSTTPSSGILKKTGDDYWQFMLDESIYLRYKYGLKIEKLPDSSFQHAQYQADFAASVLDRLQEINIDELSHEEWISLEILRWEMQNIKDGLQYYWLSVPVTPYASPLPTVHRVFTEFQLNEVADLTHYISLLKKYPTFINAILVKMTEQFIKGIILPREELDLVIPFLSSFIQQGNKSLFYVNEERLERLSELDKKEFQRMLLELIDADINPALDNLVKFTRYKYLEKAPDSVGLWQYPAGRDYYKYLIHVNTTLDISPEEIHQIGLDQVKEIDRKIDAIRQATGFDGSLDEFRNFLKTDPRFFPKTPADIRKRLNSYVGNMRQYIDSYFLRKPKAPYGVKRLPPEFEGAMTFGYYDAPSKLKPEGIYYYNASNPTQRSLLMSEGLIYHELVPGHHFHIATQSENDALPAFRRETNHNAFNEGWAEYASWLGLEMGLFQDPYSLCGKHMMDMFLSVRLVVDTGMNHLEWPRSKGAQFMKEHVLESDTQIHTETLRYSTDLPAQALGYKLGSMKMLEFRQKAEKALGDKFDIRKFHDAILGSGSMPLPILEQHIDWFIQNEQK